MISDRTGVLSVPKPVAGFISTPQPAIVKLNQGGLTWDLFESLNLSWDEFEALDVTWDAFESTDWW